MIIFWAYFISKSDPKWSFQKWSEFLFLRSLNYVNLNLVLFLLHSISQQKDIENGILLPISNEIFSSSNTPNFKSLFHRFDTSLNYGTKTFGIFYLF